MSEQANLAALAPGEWDEWHAGYVVGYRHGIKRGRVHERDEVSALQAVALAVVHRMAEIPPRDRVADEARAASSRGWWAPRRGEC